MLICIRCGKNVSPEEDALVGELWDSEVSKGDEYGEDLARFVDPNFIPSENVDPIPVCHDCLVEAIEVCTQSLRSVHTPLYLCPECNQSHTAEEWENATNIHCGYGEARPIEEGRHGMAWYKCPGCGDIIDDDITLVGEAKEEIPPPNPSDQYLCPECGQSHTAQEWDDCTEEELGVEIYSLVDPIEGGSGECWYKCPSCKEFIYKGITLVGEVKKIMPPDLSQRCDEASCVHHDGAISCINGCLHCCHTWPKHGNDGLCNDCEKRPTKEGEDHASEEVV